MKRRGQLNWRARRRGSFAPERSPFLPRGARSAALIAIAVIALEGAPRLVWAQDATWLSSPPNQDFNDAANWGPPPALFLAPPAGIAFFGELDQTIPLIEADTPLNQIRFTSSATSEYTIGVGFVGPATLTLNGPGVTNLSPVVQGIEVGSGGTLIFNNGSTAGDNNNTHYTNLAGAIVFNDSTAGTADFQNESSGTITFSNSHAGSGEIDNNEGTVNFQNGSSADSIKIFSGVTGPSAVIFSGGSTAGSAEIESLSGSSMVFNDATTAGSATITSSGLIEFHDSSTAGNATITTTAPSGLTNFHDTSNAGTATLNVGGEGVMIFFDHSSADAASIHVDGTSSVNFHDETTAGTAKITAGLAGSNAGNDPIGFTGGFVFFRGNSTAAGAGSQLIGLRTSNLTI